MIIPMSIVAVLFVQPVKVQAASAICYLGDFGTTVRQPSCPAPTNTSQDKVTYSDSGPKENVCYSSPQSPLSSGPRTLNYVPQDCDGMKLLADTYQCKSSGGTLRPSRPGDLNTNSAYVCECSGGVVAASSCASQSASSSGSSATQNLGIRPGSKDKDCQYAGTESELNGENCGIIDILNTVFNFVSGGVALAVIFNIIIAGIQYSTAQGDPSAVGKSKKRIMDAVLALLMYAMLYAFIQWLIPGGVF